MNKCGCETDIFSFLSSSPTLTQSPICLLLYLKHPGMVLGKVKLGSKRQWVNSLKVSLYAGHGEFSLQAAPFSLPLLMADWYLHAEHTLQTSLLLILLPVYHSGKNLWKILRKRKECCFHPESSMSPSTSSPSSSVVNSLLNSAKLHIDSGEDTRIVFNPRIKTINRRITRWKRNHKTNKQENNLKETNQFCHVAWNHIGWNFLCKMDKIEQIFFISKELYIHECLDLKF